MGAKGQGLPGAMACPPKPRPGGGNKRKLSSLTGGASDGMCGAVAADGNARQQGELEKRQHDGRPSQRRRLSSKR